MKKRELSTKKNSAKQQPLLMRMAIPMFGQAVTRKPSLSHGRNWQRFVKRRKRRQRFKPKRTRMLLLLRLRQTRKQQLPKQKPKQRLSMMQR